MHSIFLNVCINIQHGLGICMTFHSSTSARFNFQKNHVELAWCKNSQEHFSPYVHYLFQFYGILEQIRNKIIEENMLFKFLTVYCFLLCWFAGFLPSILRF